MSHHLLRAVPVFCTHGPIWMDFRVPDDDGAPPRRRLVEADSRDLGVLARRSNDLIVGGKVVPIRLGHKAPGRDAPTIGRAFGFGVAPAPDGRVLLLASLVLSLTPAQRRTLGATPGPSISRANWEDRRLQHVESVDLVPVPRLALPPLPIPPV